MLTGSFFVPRACCPPNGKDEPLHPAKYNRGKQDQSTPCSPQVDTVPPKYRQRKPRWDVPNKSWRQQTPKGTSCEQESVLGNSGDDRVLRARVSHHVL